MKPTVSRNEWFENSQEAQLSVDVFREGDALVVRSPVAGVKPEDVDLSLHGDLLTIRGTRQHTTQIPEEDWYYRENYWGSFSRSIVLPHDVAVDRAKASIKNGILEVRIPVVEHGKKLKVKWADGPEPIA